MIPVSAGTVHASPRHADTRQHSPWGLGRGRSPHFALQMGPAAPGSPNILVKMRGAPASNAPAPLTSCSEASLHFREFKNNPKGEPEKRPHFRLLPRVSSSNPHGDCRGMTCYLPMTEKRPLRAHSTLAHNNSSTLLEAHPRPGTCCAAHSQIPRSLQLLLRGLCANDAVVDICDSFQMQKRGLSHMPKPT